MKFVNYFTIFKTIVLKPSEFFKKMSHEDNFLHALIFSIIFLLITAVTGYIFDTIYIGNYIMIPGTIFVKGLFQISFISSLFTIGTILSFKLFGGGDNYKDTFIIVAYANAVLPLEFLPIFPINTFMSIYRIHICIRGGQLVHNLTYWKSGLLVLLGMSVIPILIYLLIFELISSEYSIL